MIYTKKDVVRLPTPNKNLSFENIQKESYRTPWRRDYARLIHSPSFRRLQGKTQLFPGQESDFFRNRLTHSLEVSQIAKSIAIKLNYNLGRKKNTSNFKIEPDIAEFAGLAHDLGHPPFGHLGEEVLDEKMKDWGGFEGNAQTLRILTLIEHKFRTNTSEFGITNKGADERVGLHLTSRCLASILKYNLPIPVKYSERKLLIEKGLIKKIDPVKGYYISEDDIVNEIKKNVVGVDFSGKFKTIECQIMDIADDIAYSTYDLEDSFKAGFLTPLQIISAPDSILKKIADKINISFNTDFSSDDIQDIIDNLFHKFLDPPFKLSKNVKLKNKEFSELHKYSLRIKVTDSNDLVSKGSFRTDFTSKLVGKYIKAVEFDGNINTDYPQCQKIKLNESVKFEVEVLKQFTYIYQIESQKLRMVALRGKEIVGEIFDKLNDDDGFELLPADFKAIFKSFHSNELNQKRTICDFIAGMTDSYAIEFYGRFKSGFPQSIFKPI